jgi:hypothetical protein
MLCLKVLALICLINNFLVMLKEEILSLNSDFSEFDLLQLEDRLETDPLAVGGLLDLVNEDTPMPTCWFRCPHLQSCDLQC